MQATHYIANLDLYFVIIRDQYDVENVSYMVFCITDATASGLHYNGRINQYVLDTQYHAV